MAQQMDPASCTKDPAAIREALIRRPEWRQHFEQEFLAAAADFDQGALDAVIEKWFPFACACATPGYLDEVEEIAQRVADGDATGMIFRDAAGNAFDAENNPIPSGR